MATNIAEAVGRASDAERRHSYAISRGEAMECGAIIDVVRLLNVIDPDELASAKMLVKRSVEMLSKLCR